MLTFYRTPDDPVSDEIEERLETLVLAREVVRVDRPDDLDGILPPDTPLPALVENGRVYTGREAIMALVDEVAGEAAVTRMISADACYVDPNRRDGCL